MFKRPGEIVFVFGSNLAGRHGKGAALYAKKKYGAQQGCGIGRTGNAYAIPTKDDTLNVLPISEIKKYVREFRRYAREHDDVTFLLTPVGTGLAGYSKSAMRALFKNLPANVKWTESWNS